MAKCPFCPATTGLTNEHIIPKWLQKELGIQSHQLLGLHSTYGVTNSSRKQSFGSLVNGSVCADCNNGWMSGMEAAIKPVLAPMLQPNAAMIGASMAMALQAKFISLWVLKTAGMLNAASNYRPIIPASHVAGVKEGALPPHTFFSAGFCSNPATTWRQSQTFFFGSSPDRKPPETKYKVSFQFGSLLLQVAHLDGAWREPESFNSIWLWPEFRVTKTGHLFENIDNFDIEGGYEVP